MHDADTHQRVLRKLERLFNRPLDGLRPRIYKALGITNADHSPFCPPGATGQDAGSVPERVAGCPPRQTNARFRRELGL